MFFAAQETTRQPNQVTLKTRPSSRIVLHNLIISRDETSALVHIDQIVYSPNTSPPLANISLCYRSPTENEYHKLMEPITILSQINKKYGAIPHPFEINGGFLQNALQLAAAYGLERVSKKLLELGIAVNYRDGFGRTALYYAANGRHNNIIKLLIQHGARVDLRDMALSAPFDAYLRSSENSDNFSKDIIVSLRIDWLKNQRANATENYHIQKFCEQFSILQMSVDEASEDVGQDFYTARREHRVPNQDMMLEYSRKNLLFLVKFINRINSLSTRCIEEGIINEKILESFVFFGSLFSNVAKETKSPYQDSIPWQTLEFLGCLIKFRAIIKKEDFSSLIIKILNEIFPIIKNRLILVVNEFSQWETKNSQVLQVPPYRDKKLGALYDISDYFHDLRSLQEILSFSKMLDNMDMSGPHARRGLIQIIKKVADVSKYQHAGRNLTRTIKQQVPDFPWNEFGELRDKLAKISLDQENVQHVQDLIANGEQFFCELKKELLIFFDALQGIHARHQALKGCELEQYYISEPCTRSQAESDMCLSVSIVQSDGLVAFIEDIKKIKLEKLIAEQDKTKRNIHELPSKLLPEKKEELIKKFQEKIHKIQGEIDEKSKPLNDIRDHVLCSSLLSLQQQRFLLQQCSHHEQAQKKLKKIIIDHSQFKKIIELESVLSLRTAKPFETLDRDHKVAIIERTEGYMVDLTELLIPDDKQLEKFHTVDIFAPGHDELGAYLIEQHKRISENPTLLFSAHYLAVELQQSLRFLGFGGNPAFRTHLEHSEPVFETLSADRSREDLNEALKSIAHYKVKLQNLKKKTCSIKNQVGEKQTGYHQHEVLGDSDCDSTTYNKFFKVEAQKKISFSHDADSLDGNSRYINVSGHGNNCGLFALTLGVKRALTREPIEALPSQRHFLTFINFYGEVDFTEITGSTDIIGQELRKYISEALKQDETFKTGRYHNFVSMLVNYVTEQSLPPDMEALWSSNEACLRKVINDWKALSPYLSVFGEDFSPNLSNISEEQVEVLLVRIRQIISDNAQNHSEAAEKFFEEHKANKSMSFKLYQKAWARVEERDALPEVRHLFNDTMVKYFRREMVERLIGISEAERKVREACRLGFLEGVAFEEQLTLPSIEATRENARSLLIESFVVPVWEEIYQRYLEYVRDNPVYLSADELGCLAKYWNVQLEINFQDDARPPYRSYSELNSNLLRVVLCNPSQGHWMVDETESSLEHKSLDEIHGVKGRPHTQTSIPKATQIVLGSSLILPEGLQYEPIPGNGHCLYNAVGLYLGRSQEALRAEVADYIEAHLHETEFTGILNALIPEGSTIHDYVRDVREGVEWADNLEIFILP